jgi:adenylyl-sulfate kinase
MLDRVQCLWLTGLPASGKSTLALSLRQQLVENRYSAVILDGDHLREGINADLSFEPADRKESVRRAGEIARLLVNSGVFVISSLVSPYIRDRLEVRERFEPGQFVEVFVDTPLSVCESRDPKGHYRRARAGRLTGFTGVDAPYERPISPEFHLQFDGSSAAETAKHILAEIKRSNAVMSSGHANTGLLKPAGLRLS